MRIREMLRLARLVTIAVMATLSLCWGPAEAEVTINSNCRQAIKDQPRQVEDFLRPYRNAARQAHDSLAGTGEDAQRVRRLLEHWIGRSRSVTRRLYLGLWTLRYLNPQDIEILCQQPRTTSQWENPSRLVIALEGNTDDTGEDAFVSIAEAVVAGSLRLPIECISKNYAAFLDDVRHDRDAQPFQVRWGTRE